MTKGWPNEPQKHALASKGIETKITHQFQKDDIESLVKTYLHSPHIKNTKVVDWTGNEIAIGFRLKEHRNSKFRSHDSTIYLKPTEDGIFINGELRFPYSEDNDMLEQINSKANQYLQEKNFNTKSWILPHNPEMFSDKDYWSSHLHFKKTVNPKYIDESIQAVSEAINQYYRGVDNE